MKLKVILFFSFLALFVSPTYATINAPANVKALEVTDTGITLDWDDTTNAMGYYVYYGTKTGSGGVYEVEGIDLIEESNFTITNLSPATKYYMAVTAIDTEGTESSYSQEVEDVTLKAGQTSNSAAFRIKNVEVKNETTLELIFSTNLDTSPNSPREFTIENTKTKTQIPVEISEVDSTNSKNVIAILQKPLSSSTTYKVTVLDMKDAQGNSIESGIDAFMDFMTPASFMVDEPVNTTNTPVDNNTEGTVTPGVDLNAAPIDSVTETGITTQDNQVGNIAGTNLTSEDIGGTTLNAAQENDKLPQTGPEHWFLLFIALLLSGIIYIYGNKKAIFR